MSRDIPARDRCIYDHRNRRDVTSDVERYQTEDKSKDQNTSKNLNYIQNNNYCSFVVLFLLERYDYFA